MKEEGLGKLLDELKARDPEYAGQVDSKNPQRVIRALEVCMSTSKTYSEFRKSKSDIRPFKILKYCLDRPREELYQRIDARMEAMFDNSKFITYSNSSTSNPLAAISVATKTRVVCAFPAVVVSCGM